jgi:hypothetical protein
MIINQKYLNLEKYKESFQKNKPFPHIILDNFLSDSFYSELQIGINEINHDKGKKFESDFEKNKWISANSKLPIKIKEIIDALNSDKWVKNLSYLSNIENIFSTNVGNTKLANYHEMKNEGYLGPHVDHSDDPETGSPHVLNLLLYLSKEWEDEWGGSTLLFDQRGKKILNEVKYKPNRAIIFLHTPYSFHGVKEITKNNSVRSSIYVDYYVKSKDPYKNIDLDFNRKWFKHGTYFVLPKAKDYFKIKYIKYIKTFLTYNIKRILFG